MNTLVLAGHLGADPEVRFTSSGQKLTILRLATRVRRGRMDDTIWWRVTVWGDNFDRMMPYFKKGGAIIVTGELNKPEIYTDKNGQPQISMSITATNLMFPPFGRQENREEKRESTFASQEEKKQDSEENSSFDEESFAGFSSGEKEDSSDPDDDMPF